MKNHKLTKWIVSLLTAALLVSCMCIPALAATTTLNLDEKGSISISLPDVKDGTLTLFQVADLGYDKEGYIVYTKTDAFDGFDGDLDVENTSLAGTLAEYVTENSVTGTAAGISSSGEVSYTDLVLGLYLVVQTEQSTGFYTIDPFVVTVPVVENDEVIYNVNASPKTEVNPEPETSPTPSESPEPDSSPTPTTTTTGTPGTTGGNGGNGGGTGTNKNLPQTGQLNWPIALFSVLGVIFVVVGIVLVNTGRKKRNSEA